MAENQLLEYVNTIFKDFEEGMSKLETIPNKAATDTTTLLDLFFDTEKDVFDKPQDFLKALDSLSEEIGHAYHMVQAIELKRLGLEKPPPMPTLPTPSKEAPSPSQVIVQGQPQTAGGFWNYMGTRQLAAAWKRYLDRQDGLLKPEITTGREVVDFSEFGRQLIPEFNEVQDNFQQCIDHIYFFDDKSTRERLRSDLRTHLSKLCGIIRAFCRTIAEYRKELIGERKLAAAQSIMSLQMAEYQALGGISKSDLYKMASEMAGPEDASRR